MASEFILHVARFFGSRFFDLRWQHTRVCRLHAYFPEQVCDACFNSHTRVLGAADWGKQIGLGIHGEAGMKQTGLQTADELTDAMISAIVDAESEGAQREAAPAGANRDLPLSFPCLCVRLGVLAHKLIRRRSAYFRYFTA